MSPSYWSVFLTFARNSLVRDMTFRWNFILDAITSVTWMLMNLGFYVLIFAYTPMIGRDSGWGKHEFFVFIATTMVINSIVQAFFMPNAEELSELIRTGGLDFALLKPIDTQFLVSLHRIYWSALANFGLALLLMAYALSRMNRVPSLLEIVLYVPYVLCGVAILYSLMISLAATSIWLGRNQSLYDFWFYITNFSRYPMEIYSGNLAGDLLRRAFTFVVPVLVVVNVPARLLALPMTAEYWYLALYALAATALSLGASRWIFLRALASYRSASS
jgi:ABC-2 type transport system permease protein